MPKHPAEAIDHMLATEIVALLVLSLREMRGGGRTDPDRLTGLIREAVAIFTLDELRGVQNLTGLELLGWLRHEDPTGQFTNAELGAMIGASHYRLLALTNVVPDWRDQVLCENERV